MLLNFSPGHISPFGHLFQTIYLFSWSMLLDTRPFASGPTKTIMQAMCQHLKGWGMMMQIHGKLGLQSKTLFQKKKIMPKLYALYLLARVRVNSYPSSCSEWSKIIYVLCIVISYCSVTGWTLLYNIIWKNFPCKMPLLILKTTPKFLRKSFLKMS